MRYFSVLYNTTTLQAMTVQTLPEFNSFAEAESYVGRVIVADGLDANYVFLIEGPYDTAAENGYYQREYAKAFTKHGYHLQHFTPTSFSADDPGLKSSDLPFVIVMTPFPGPVSGHPQA